MPLPSGGSKTLWILTGVFLFMCVLVITATAEALPIAFCLPAFYAILAARHTEQARFMVLATAPAALIVLPGLMPGVVIYLCLIVCGIILYRFTKDGRITLSVLIPSCIVFALCVAGAEYAAYISGGTLQTVVAGWVREVMDQVSILYSQSLSKSAYADFMLAREGIESRVVQLFWGMVASLCLSMMWMNLLISSGKKRADEIRAWKSPDWTVAFFIMAGVLVLMSHEIAHALGLNLLIVVLQVYFFQGLAILASTLAWFNWSKLIRWVIYILILTQIYMMIVLAIFGLFDTWFDFRKKIRNTKGEET